MSSTILLSGDVPPPTAAATAPNQRKRKRDDRRNASVKTPTVDRRDEDTTITVATPVTTTLSNANDEASLSTLQQWSLDTMPLVISWYASYRNRLVIYLSRRRRDTPDAAFQLQWHCLRHLLDWSLRETCYRHKNASTRRCRSPVEQVLNDVYTPSDMRNLWCRHLDEDGIITASHQQLNSDHQYSLADEWVAIMVASLFQQCQGNALSPTWRLLGNAATFFSFHENELVASIGKTETMPIPTSWTQLLWHCAVVTNERLQQQSSSRMVVEDNNDDTILSLQSYEYDTTRLFKTFERLAMPALCVHMFGEANSKFQDANTSQPIASSTPTETQQPEDDANLQPLVPSVALATHQQEVEMTMYSDANAVRRDLQRLMTLANPKQFIEHYKSAIKCPVCGRGKFVDTRSRQDRSGDEGASRFAFCFNKKAHKENTPHKWRLE